MYYGISFSFSSEGDEIYVNMYIASIVELAAYMIMGKFFYIIKIINNN
jgi:hypothetical protein